MSLIVIVLIVLLLAGGGYGYSSGWDGRSYGGLVGLFLLIILLYILLGHRIG